MKAHSGVVKLRAEPLSIEHRNLKRYGRRAIPFFYLEDVVAVIMLLKNRHSRLHGGLCRKLLLATAAVAPSVAVGR